MIAVALFSFLCLIWFSAKKAEAVDPALSARLNKPVSLFLLLFFFSPFGLMWRTFKIALDAVSFSNDLAYITTIFVALNAAYCIFLYYALLRFYLFHKNGITLIKIFLCLLPIVYEIFPFLFYVSCEYALGKTNEPMFHSPALSVEDMIIAFVFLPLPYLLYFSFSKVMRETQNLIDEDKKHDIP